MDSVQAPDGVTEGRCFERRHLVPSALTVCWRPRLADDRKEYLAGAYIRIFLSARLTCLCSSATRNCWRTQSTRSNVIRSRASGVRGDRAFAARASRVDAVLSGMCTVTLTPRAEGPLPSAAERTHRLSAALHPPAHSRNISLASRPRSPSSSTASSVSSFLVQACLLGH